jgi:hypothetical protein
VNRGTTLANVNATKTDKVVKTAKTPEQKAKAFKDLASVRVNKALKAMRQLKHLSNKSAYHYTETDVSKIVNVLSSATKEVEASFKDPSAAKSEGFTL